MKLKTQMQMNDKEMLDLLFLSQKGIIFAFFVIFGFAAGEAYQSLKTQANYKFKKAIPKLILSFFVCVICIPLINRNEFAKEYFPICIGLISFLYMPIANFLAKDFLPMLIEKLLKQKKENQDQNG